MEKSEVIKSIGKRAGGDIYLGVVGAVRTGKSTFIRKFMENLVIPNIEDEYERKRCLDELPQAAAGKTIMTTEPKFVPATAAKIMVDDFPVNIRMIDCVGYVIKGAKGYEDGSINDIKRTEYEEAETTVIDELSAIGKPYIVLLNSTHPMLPDTEKLADKLKENYKVPVLPVNIESMSERDMYNILKDALYEYTKDVLIKLKELNYDPKIISIGNEITNGMCWPIGHIDNRENLIGLINSGIKAVKEIMPESRIMLHLDNGGNNNLYRDFFDRYFDMGGSDFDYIGLSYYPLWHGSLDSLKNNLDDLANRYDKDLLIVETSFPFTDKDYKEYEGLEDSERKGMASKKELLDKLDIEVSKDGQIIYMDKLINIINSIKNNKCRGFIYWGGESIPVKGVSWATSEGLKYMNEKGPLGNEWANQALFDYDGNSLPVLNFIKKIK